jgi:eukaryotic-like serine/threonine-protein kinase
MDHLDERALLGLVASGSLSELERGPLGAHLESCPECRGRVDTLIEVETHVRTLALESGALDAPAPSRPTGLLLVPGDMVEHFRIEESLGGGGMAQVYLALDTRLDRRVVIKMIRPELVDSAAARERFLFEARATARFNHPNIVIIHGVAEHAGAPYLVLEHLTGADLRTRAKAGLPDPSEGLRITLAVADALGEAHRRGILHLDLKPANVFVTDEGAVRVLDFGLAKSLGARETGQQLAGTPAYMAPEQWRGKDIGAATDVWALGVMLYELVSNRRPFFASGIPALAIAICSGPPPEALPPEVEPSLARLVAACLDRDPRGRPSAVQVAEALRGVLAARCKNRAPEAPILAVIPLGVRGAGAEGFGDAITDELIDLLSRMRGWKVLAGAATARYRDGWEPRAVASELGAQAIVHGTVQLSGDRVRVTARLVDARTGSQTWSGRYGGSAADILELSDNLSRRIAEELRSEITATIRRGDASAEAVALYLRARQKLAVDQQLGPDGAIELLERCLEMAPSFAPAMSAHAVAAMRGWYSPEGIEARDWEPVVRQSVARALERAPDLPETHFAAGRLHSLTGAYAEAVRSLARALDIAPTCASAHGYLAMLECEGGRAAVGIRRARLAVDLDPGQFNSLFDIMRVHALLGDWDAYEATVREVSGRAPPRHPSVHLVQIRIAAWRGDRERMKAGIAALGPSRTPILDLVALPARVFLGELGFHDALAHFRSKTRGVAHPRFRALADQLYAETAFLCGLDDTGAKLVLSAANALLVDVEWLDRCPALAPMRARPEFADARAKVVARAQAIWEGDPPPLEFA